MNKVVIGMGSNRGDRENYLSLAVEKLGLLLTHFQCSSIYETKAVGMEEGHDQDFLNMVCFGFTTLSPTDLLAQLILIENELGRVRGSGENYLSRTLDLDLLFYNEDIIQLRNLTIPHPRLQERSFVIYPLMELMPDFIIPGMKKSIKDCMTELENDSEIIIFKNVV